METVKKDPSTQEQCRLPPLSSKEQRRQVHQIIRKAFPAFLSNTDADSILLLSASNQNQFHKVHRAQWPHPDLNYVEFTLQKKGKDTMSVINSLSNTCHRAPKMFSYYGTKDKRAITFQKVVAYRISPVEFLSSFQ